MKKRDYFEGWYFKQTNGQITVSFIPSYHIDSAGNLLASLQIITDEKSYSFIYLAKEFCLDKKNLKIKIGNNEFSKKGLFVNINQNDLKIEGKLHFYDLTPPIYDIMGPFLYFPLQCKHGVISIRHRVEGELFINGKKYLFNDGIGYIETDRGKSFPKKYLWTQCNSLDGKNIDIMLSVATVKTFLGSFNGVICSVYYLNKEIRIATYKGAKILEFNEKGAKIKQGKLMLTVSVKQTQGHNLNAPINGVMKRIVVESPSCIVEYSLFDKNKEVFSLICNRASFEYADGE